MGEVDYAWAAGFIEGEGCFYLRGKDSQGKIRSYLYISQSRAEPLEKIKRLAGSGNLYHVEKRGHWRLTIRDRTVLLVFVEKILPYLCSRREEAEIFLEATERKNPRGGRGMEYSKGQVNWFQDAEARMRKARGNGRNL